jgi:hypothetical protein
MGKVYRVFEVEANKLHPPSRDMQEAIAFAKGMAELDQIDEVEVHEFEADDTEFRNPVLVYPPRPA